LLLCVRADALMRTGMSALPAEGGSFLLKTLRATLAGLAPDPRPPQSLSVVSGLKLILTETRG
jgi:hypothetical protein